MNNTSYALGFFDGVHIGHAALLTKCREMARSAGCRCGAVTFGAHPDTLVLHQTPVLINAPRDRELLLREKFHMDTVVTLPFDEQMRSMPWADFLEMLRRDYGAAGFVCGDDFRFGSRGEGSVEKLRSFCAERGLPCVIVPEQILDGVRISSTYIRRQIETGDMATAVRFLGHGHTLTGTVVTGRRLGHKLGFPTANIELPADVVCPRHGVYACRAYVGKECYMAVCNVGNRPTVEGHQVRTETWLLDFEGDLYGKSVTLEFLYFLRPEQRFASLDELKNAVLHDAKITRNYFEK